MKLKIIVFSMIAASFLTTGCGKKTDDAQKAAEDSSKAAQQMTNPAANASGAAAKTSGVAVPAKTLASFLATPSGFTMQGEPQTTELSMQGKQYSQAVGEYTNGDKKITISIFDYNYITGLSAAFAPLMSMNMETNDEAMHSETISGFPGWIDWKKKENSGNIGVVVNDRIFVVTEAKSGISQDELKAAASGVNYSGIAGAVK